MLELSRKRSDMTVSDRLNMTRQCDNLKDRVNLLGRPSLSHSNVADTYRQLGTHKIRSIYDGAPDL